ncbi:hypothetical protein D3C81_2045490 [compost metagenome]
MFCGFNVHLDDVPGRGVLHRVVQQVDQRPAQMGDLDVHLRVAPDFNADLGVFENEVQILQGRGHLIGQRG